MGCDAGATPWISPSSSRRGMPVLCEALAMATSRTGLALAVAALAVPIPVQAAPSAAELEAQLDAAVSPAEMSEWMKTMASEPNHVSSAHDKLNAELVLKQFKDWGWDARIETF